MAEDPEFEFGEFRLRTSDGSLFRGGELVALPPKALQVLLVLVRNHGQVVSHHQLVAAVWPDTVVEEGNLKVYISMLRKTLGEGVAGREVVQTVPRRGYRFVAELTAASPIQPAPATQSNWKRVGWATAVASLLVLAAGFALSRGTAGQPPRVLAVHQLTAEGIVCAACPLVADSERVYFTRSRGNRTEIASIPVNGGPPTLIPAEFPNPTVLDVSPARKELLVSSVDRVQDQRTFWIIPLTGGGGKALGFRGFDAAWSSDGNHIAYTHDSEVHFVNRGGAKEREPVRAEGFACKVRWSPDGTRVTYTVLDDQSGSVSLWEVNPGGGATWRVGGGARHALFSEGERSGGWSADGAHFLFFSFQRSGSGEGSTTIWTRGPASNLPAVRLHDVPGDTAGSLAASRDGKHVFFNARRQQFEQARYDSRLREFVPLASGVPATNVEFSPDGKWIVYVPETGVGLWRSRPNGSERTQLVAGPAYAFHPRWSPDGLSIAVTIVEGGTPKHIAILRPEQGTMERATAQNYEVDNANWSPDGRNLLVTGCEIVQAARKCESRLLMVNLQTKSVLMTPQSEGMGGPTWSPDGRYIAAHIADQSELRVFDVARRTWKVAQAGGFLTHGFWTKSSEYLYFQDLSDRPSQPILRYDVGLGTVERITPQTISLPGGVSAFRLAGVTADGDPRVALVRDNSEIFVLDVAML